MLCLSLVTLSICTWIFCSKFFLPTEGACLPAIEVGWNYQGIYIPEESLTSDVQELVVWQPTQTPRVSMKIKLKTFEIQQKQEEALLELPLFQ